MRKTDKKVEKQLISALTHVCEQALEQVSGFLWLTHTVNFNNFPQSLRVVCVFDTEEHRSQYVMSDNQLLTSLVVANLNILNIDIRKVKQLVILDSEERCKREHDGNWARRLS